MHEWGVSLCSPHTLMWHSGRKTEHVLRADTLHLVPESSDVLQHTLEPILPVP